MVQCVVVDCSHRTPRDRKKGISFHRFPLKDESRLREWLANIKRKNRPPLENCTICSAHFEPSCFLEDFRSRFLSDGSRKRFLKDNAVPTLFPHKKNTSQRPASESRKRRACHEEVNCVMANVDLII